MEKVVAALWAPGSDASGYAADVLAVLPGRLAELGASKIRINVRDEAVEPADRLNQVWQCPQQAAVAQFWLPSAGAGLNGVVGDLLNSVSSRWAAWLVEERIVLPNVEHSSTPGQRTWGWSQASFLTFREDISKAAAVTHWYGPHTRVAVETQANFEYVQNIVVRPLTKGGPAYDAFVEECFAPQAMTEPAVLYDAVGDGAKLEANIKEMMESCAAFLDFSRMDIIPTSQFDFS